MDQETLEKRIQRWEDKYTEFKAWPINPKSCAETLTAFANSDGGQFILGVDANRTIVGISDIDRAMQWAMQWVDNIAYQNCEPPLTISQEVVETAAGVAVLVIDIPKGDLRPYRTNQGDYFIRTSSGKRRATRQELLRLFQSTETFYYDENYTIAAPVRVLIFDDRVDIRTPGTLPNSVTVAAIRLGGAHITRNPIVYTLFSRLGFVTGIGSGIYRVIQAVKELSGREPELSVQEQEFVVSLPRHSG